jgi:uncharacterized protein YhaN
VGGYEEDDVVDIAKMEKELADANAKIFDLEVKLEAELNGYKGTVQKIRTQLIGSMAKLTDERNEHTKTRNELAVVYRRMKELCDAVEADLGPLDSGLSCLCDVETEVEKCAPCLAKAWLERLEKKGE